MRLLRGSQWTRVVVAPWPWPAGATNAGSPYFEMGSSFAACRNSLTSRSTSSTWRAASSARGSTRCARTRPEPAAHRRPAARRGVRARRHGRAPARQAHRVRARRRALPRPPPHDRRAPALADAGPAPKPAATAAGALAGAFEFTSGTLPLTEAGTKKRAALHARRGGAGLARARPGRHRGADRDAAPSSRRALQRESHTLKRALTDPRLFSGIGNAYSDEILHRARLSPLRLTRAAHRRRGRAAPRRDARDARRVDRPPARGDRRRASRRGSPRSAPEMAVHGRYGKPCPDVRHAGAAHRLRGRTRSTTARAARPRGGCSPTARCRGSCARTGRRRSRNWRKGARALRQRLLRRAGSLRRRGRRGAARAETCRWRGRAR